MTAGLCRVCGRRTSSGPRCAAHPKTSGPSNPFYRDPQWRHVSKRTITAHVGRYGWVCPGDGPQHAPHPSRSLTVDHILALADGGAPFAPSNLQVLCRAANSAKGARLVNDRRKTARAAESPPLLDERAAIRARYL